MKRMPLILGIAGITLIVLSMGLLLWSQWKIDQAQKQNAAVVANMRDMLPDGTPGNPAEYVPGEMPVLQLGGVDYVCMLEIPGLGIALPVQNQWEAEVLRQRPCRFWGSVYDGTCILGGSGQRGQFAFCAQLDLGNILYLTDMQGARFSFRVAHIQRAQDVRFEKLSHAEYPLTLFMRQEYSSEYIIVRCVLDL